MGDLSAMPVTVTKDLVWPLPDVTTWDMLAEDFNRDPTVQWVAQNGGDLLRIVGGAVDVALGVATMFGTFGLGALPGVGMIAIGIDQIITGELNIATGTRSQSAFEYGGYSAARGVGFDEAASQTIGGLTPAALSIGMMGAAGFFPRGVAGEAAVGRAVPNEINFGRAGRVVPNEINFGRAGRIIPDELNSGNGLRRWFVDPSTQAADEAAGVLVNGSYIRNPTARNLADMLTPTGKIGGSQMSGQFMYVIDESGNIIIGSRAGQRMPHPTLIGGENPVIQGAGIVDIRGGRIFWVNNSSGHFKPGLGSLDAARDAFGLLPGGSFHRGFLGYLPY